MCIRDRPKVIPAVPEHYISDADYENINHIISLCGTTMEKTARTYYANTEEELRDHLYAPFDGDVKVYEKEAWKKAQILPVVEDACMSTQFSHIFAGGYCRNLWKA